MMQVCVICFDIYPSGVDGNPASSTIFMNVGHMLGDWHLKRTSFIGRMTRANLKPARSIDCESHRIRHAATRQNPHSGRRNWKLPRLGVVEDAGRYRSAAQDEISTAQHA